MRNETTRDETRAMLGLLVLVVAALAVLRRYGPSLMGSLWCAALVAVLAAGCAHPRAGSVVSVRTWDSTGESHAAFCARLGTGYVLRSGDVLTVDHAAPAVGERVVILTRWRTIPAVVVRRWDGWALLRAEEHTRPGDSGAPVLAGGEWIGAVEGWARR